MELLSFCRLLLLVGVLCYLLPVRARKYGILIVSWYFFLVNEKWSLLLVLAVITISYVGGRWIEKRNSRGSFTILVLLIFSVLVLFKYVNAWMGLGMPIFLGLSYYTLMAVGYLTEVYRGKEKAEKNFIQCCLFLSFFPQVMAGPIGRSRSLLSQWEKPIFFHDLRFRTGFLMFLIGVFEKMVLADNLGILTDYIYNLDNNCEGFVLLAGMIIYAFQIYFDFAGYSLIAIGGAKMMGIELMTNFDSPYSSLSIREFWRRWHISLSSWFRDYLYIPLGGSRVSEWRIVLNTLLVFLASGIWHGTTLGFALWGLIHGVYLVMGRFTEPFREKVRKKLRLDGKIYRTFRRLVVFLLVAVAFVPFRLPEAAQLIPTIPRFFVFNPGVFTDGTFSEMGVSFVTWGICILGGIFIFILDTFQKKQNAFECMEKLKFGKRLLIYTVLMLLILTAGVYGMNYSASNFIYGQF